MYDLFVRIFESHVKPIIFVGLLIVEYNGLSLLEINPTPQNIVEHESVI